MSELGERRPGRSGRPSIEAAEELTNRVLDAATQLFLSAGFEATSIEGIAAAAGVTKRTVYSRFPGKPDVFDAVIRRVTDRRLKPLEQSLKFEGPLEQRLCSYAFSIMEWLLMPEAIALDRITTSEAERFPDLARAVHDLPVTQAVRLFSSIFEEARAKGEVDIASDEIEFVAQQFMQSVIGPALYRAVHGLDKPGLDDEKRDYARRAARLFLRGCLSKNGV